MARRATKDTYGTDDVGGGTEVRRRVFAGDIVPDHWSVEEGTTEEIPGPQSNVIGERVPAAQRTSKEEATLQGGTGSGEDDTPPAEQPTEPGSRRRRAG